MIMHSSTGAEPPAIQLENVAASVRVGEQWRAVLRDVSFVVAAGEALGIVGESGSGKSMTAKAIARLLPGRTRLTGTVRVGGLDVNTLSGRALRAHRSRVGFIFQDPKAHINPVRTIGDFMTESLVRTAGVRRREAMVRAARALGGVGVTSPERRLAQYPHELSGGLLQRVMIATVLLGEPEMILADEPTTALDVTTQSEVIAILDEMRRERNLALVFITHDLELASTVCDRTAVMYAGQIVETRASKDVHEGSRHPYTRALVGARPLLDHPQERLTVLPGRPIAPADAPAGCSFHTRCPYAKESCAEIEPELEEFDGGTVRCIRKHEIWSATTAVPR